MPTPKNGSWSADLATSAMAAIALLLSLPTCSGQSRPMPVLQATTLSGNTVDLPAATSGKPVVLVFGFTRSARDEGENWGKELVEMQKERNDFNFFQVATLSEAPHFMHGLITRAIRASVPVAYYPHMLLLKQDDKVWRDLLHARNDGSAYVVLCSPAGEIQWQTQGAGQVQFEALRSELSSYDAERR